MKKILMTTILSVAMVSGYASLAVAKDKKAESRSKVRKLLEEAKRNNAETGRKLEEALAALLGNDNGGCDDDADKKCAEVGGLSINQACKTSKGTLVKHVKRGNVEGVEINGKFWSDRLRQDYTNAQDYSAAEKECRDLGLYLPSKSEFENLRDVFEHDSIRGYDSFTDAGGKEFHTIMPDADGHYFWSSSPDSDFPADYARGFDGGNGSIGVGGRGNGHSVRCVER